MYRPKVIWSDEKIFCLHARVNKQNDRVWAVYNPREYQMNKVQGDQKAMVWVGLVGGQVLARYWFLEPEEEQNISCNSENYVAMLKRTVLPAIARRSDRDRLWFMQDGAPAHHANNTLSFLSEKFGDRLIALGTRDNPMTVIWPPHSPELNVCDYWLWSYIEMRVKKRKPTTKEELIEFVDEELNALNRDGFIFILGFMHHIINLTLQKSELSYNEAVEKRTRLAIFWLLYR